MTTEIIIDKILKLQIFSEKPPVLLDIGASGQIHQEWKDIARYSACIGFDADSRDFTTDTSQSGFRKLHLINAIVSDKEDLKTKFYLTSSPYCSSALKPINSELANWAFHGLFEVDKEVDLDNRSLKTALTEKKINYVDWFKTDSQGIDLRLFKNLPKEVQENIIVAEFEPGFIDAYEGEDKISDLLVYIEKLPFWMSDCEVKGTQRISKITLNKYKLDSNALNLRVSSCWAEFTYINTCKHVNQRGLLLAIVFSIVKKQYGFALDVCTMLEGKMDKELFNLIETFLLEQIKVKEVSLMQKIKNKLS